jgi:hypothetical protein
MSLFTFAKNQVVTTNNGVQVPTFSVLEPFSFYNNIFSRTIPYGKTLYFSSKRSPGSISLAYLLLSELTRSDIKVLYISPKDFGFLSAYEMGINFNNLIMTDCPKEKLQQTLSISIKGSVVIVINLDLLKSIKNMNTVFAKIQAERSILVALEPFKLNKPFSQTGFLNFDYIFSPIKSTYNTTENFDFERPIEGGRLLKRNLVFQVMGRRVYKPREVSVILPQIPRPIKTVTLTNFKNDLNLKVPFKSKSSA